MAMETVRLLIKVELLLCAFGLAGTNDFVKSETRLSKDRASRRCTNKGSRLVDYSEIQSSLEPQIMPLLANGESVWINGYTKFSSFLAEHGCFKTPKKRSDLTSYMYTLKTANLYFCSKQCLRDKGNVAYIGIENIYCFCFDNRESVKTDIVNSSLCTFRCSNFATGLCGGPNYINLYRIVTENEIVWAEHQPSPRQCVYVQLMHEGNARRFSASTFSCFATNGVDGYICKNSRFSALDTDKCHDLTRDYCLVKKKSTRQNAFTDCLNRNGALTEYFGERFSVTLMEYDQRYWISVFRTFEPTYQRVNKGMACLAVRKVSGKIYLEPDSCMARKRYLCRVNKSTIRASGTVCGKTSLPPALPPMEVSTASDKDRRFPHNTTLIRDNLTVLSTTKAAMTLLITTNVKTTKKPTLSGAVTDNDDLPSTTKRAETSSSSVTHRKVINKNVSDKGYSSTTNTPETTLNPSLAISVKTTNVRSKTYKVDSTSANDKRITRSSEQNTLNPLSTASVNANINASNQSRNDVSMIVYILPSSLLFLVVIPVIIGLVLYIRKLNRQKELKRRSLSKPSYSYARSSDTDHNYSTQFTESFLNQSSIYQIAERSLQPKDRNFTTQTLHDDQYDRIEFVEIKPKICVDTNQYDHALHGTENRYNNIEGTRPHFMYSLAKDITPFTSFDRSEDGMTSAVQRGSETTDSHCLPMAYSNFMQKEEQHIYEDPTAVHNV